MNTKKMSVKPFVQPIAQLRLYEPVLNGFIVRKGPGILIAGNIQRKMFIACNFNSQVESRGCIIQRIRFDGNHLRPGTESTTQTDKDETGSIHRYLLIYNMNLKTKICKIYIFINRIDTEYTFGQIYCIYL